MIYRPTPTEMRAMHAQTAHVTRLANSGNRYLFGMACAQVRQQILEQRRVRPSTD